MSGPGVLGYTSRLSAAPSESLDVCLSSSSDLAVDVVEIMGRGRSGAAEVRPVAELAAFSVDAAIQPTVVGSCLIVDLPLGMWPETAAGTLMTWVRPGADRQPRDAGLIALLGDDGRLSVGLDRDGHPTVWQAAISDARSRVLVRLPSIVRAAEWACVVCSWSYQLDRIELFQLFQERGGVRPLVSRAGRLDGLAPIRATRIVAGALAAAGPAAFPSAITGALNGRLAQPSAWRTALRPGLDGSEHTLEQPAALEPRELVVSFDFAQNVSTFVAVDVGPAAISGELPNAPTRGVTGPRWDGQSYDFRACPDGFDAVHFHDDDLRDAGWPSSIELEIPAGTKSGVYAVRASGQSGSDLVPFVVSAPHGRPRAPVAFLLPTMTYLAYGNRAYTPPDEAVLEEMMAAVGRTLEWGRTETVLRDSDTYGLSLYDRHRDGSPVVYASCRRPLLDVRIDHLNCLTREPRHLAADIALLGWLRRRRTAVDVICDHDAHARGAHALDAYGTVIVGSHPEYVSSVVHDALQRHVAAGGRLIYLGGNGLWWVVGHRPEEPDLIEVRKGSVITPLSADNQPSEEVMSISRERGGLWRHRGRPVERLLGVGSISSGLGAGVPYRRTAASYEPATSWVFDGVAAPDGIVGRRSDGGGPAGDELDCASAALGTPPETVVLATSSEPPPGHVVFEQKPDAWGAIDPAQLPHADMVLIPGWRGAGDVFSVGSIAWINHLDHPDVGAITGNVLDRFVDASSQPA